MKAIFIVLALFVAFPVQAQSFVTGVERTLSITTTPTFPAAEEMVTVSLSGYAVDIDRSLVVWYVDEKEVKRGPGLRTLEVQAPSLGSTKTIRVVAEEPSGILAAGEATLRPASVTLLWEADSYTPPFYRGRALPGSESPIRAAAIPNLRRGATLIPTDEIIFTWLRDGARFTSGRGLSSVTFAGPSLFDTDRITVVAESLDGTIVARNEIILRGADPKIELYEHHPLFGTLYHRAFVGTVMNRESEQKFAAVPFFASYPPRDPRLTYTWSVNATDIAPDPKAPDILKLRRDDTFSGVITITLSLSSVVDLYLKATNAWSVQLSNESVSFNPFLSL